MNVTSKSRYALKLMIELASARGDLRSRADVARRQGIPLDYMDQILSRLRGAGLVKTTRGRAGGLSLNRNASQISAWEIFDAVEDGLQPVRCLDETDVCVASYLCSTRDAWSQIAGAVHKALDGIILADLAERTHNRIDEANFEVNLVRAAHPSECRAPKRSIGANR